MIDFEPYVILDLFEAQLHLKNENILYIHRGSFLLHTWILRCELHLDTYFVK